MFGLSYIITERECFVHDYTVDDEPTMNNLTKLLIYRSLNSEIHTEFNLSSYSFDNWTTLSHKYVHKK